MRVKEFVAGDVPSSGLVNICGVLVHVRADRCDEVSRRLADLPGVEVHHAEPDGRLVVTVEDTQTTAAGEVMHRFYDVDGVMSAALVYHYHDDVQGDLRGGEV